MSAEAEKLAKFKATLTKFVSVEDADLIMSVTSNEEEVAIRTFVKSALESTTPAQALQEVAAICKKMKQVDELKKENATLRGSKRKNGQRSDKAASAAQLVATRRHTELFSSEGATKEVLTALLEASVLSDDNGFAASDLTLPFETTDEQGNYIPGALHLKLRVDNKRYDPITAKHTGEDGKFDKKAYEANLADLSDEDRQACFNAQAEHNNALLERVKAGQFRLKAFSADATKDSAVEKAFNETFGG